MRKGKGGFNSALSKYKAYAQVCKHFNLSYMDLQQLTWSEYMCLYAVTLDLQEWDDYRWWINSQLETKKQRWKWADQTKGGTKPLPQNIDWVGFQAELKGTPKIDIEVAKKATDKTILKKIGSKLYFEDGRFYLDLHGLHPNEIAAKTRNFMVIRGS